MADHDWKCIEAGNTYSEYKCRTCKKTCVVDMEDPGPPTDGCWLTVEELVGKTMAQEVEDLIHDNLGTIELRAVMAKKLAGLIMPLLEQKVGQYTMEIERLKEQLRLYLETARNR